MKEKINLLFKKYKIVLIALIFIIIIVIYLLIPSPTKTVKSSPKLEKKTNIKKEKINITTEKVKQKTVKVDIKGYVANPNVYEVEENSRVIDVINIAGGLIEGANTELINLSQKVKDEMTIIIYSNVQINDYRNSKKEIVYVEVEKCPDKINDACINKQENSSKETKTDEIGTNEKISINSADEIELTKISGIGESKAKDIIEYRKTNGPFKQIDDIKNVKGIGEALFEKIKDNIIV